ncbi:MAG: hypothetical protein ACPGYV_13115 [Phycisphaeraceae bacterium]
MPTTPPPPKNPNVFDPPTAEQLAEHLERHPAINVSGWQTRAPLFAIVALAAVGMLLLNQPGFALLPLLGLLALMAYLSGRARTARELQARTTRVWELAMIRRYREALGQAWELIPACRTRPDLHGRSITVIAHVLGELGRDEAAEVAYGYLLDRLPPDHPLALRLRLQRAIAALCSGRLADGDEALRKLRGAAESSKDPTLRAALRLARLVQDVHTGHYADAVDEAEQTEAALFDLGVEAGYGHGLLALCFHQLAKHDPSADNQQRQRLADRARSLWNNATLLIPAAALVYRHPDLAPLLDAMHTTPADTDQ